MKLLNLNIGIKLDNTNLVIDLINKENSDICTFQETMNAIDDSCFKTTLNNNELTITDFDESCGRAVVVPTKIGDYNVTTISTNSFYGKYLTKAVIPFGIKKIERNSFGYNNITEVIIPDSVTSLECSAFDDFVVIDKRDELVCSNSFTDESCFTTQVSNGEIIITDYDKSCGVVVTIPNYIDNKPVVTIDEIAFKSKELIRLNLPNYLKKISNM